MHTGAHIQTLHISLISCPSRYIHQNHVYKPSRTSFHVFILKYSGSSFYFSLLKRKYANFFLNLAHSGQNSEVSSLYNTVTGLRLFGNLSSLSNPLTWYTGSTFRPYSFLKGLVNCKCREQLTVHPKLIHLQHNSYIWGLGAPWRVRGRWANGIGYVLQDSVFYSQQEGCTHEISTIWSLK